MIFELFELFGTSLAYFGFILVGVLALLGLRLVSGRRIPKGLRLPPGPPGQPFVGNISQMPTRREWVTFAQWAKEYGDLVYLYGWGKSIVVINSAEIAYELFDKRSSIYSDRGEHPMITDLMGYDWITSFLHYGEQWRRHRKVMHQKFHPHAAAEYQPIQLRHTRTFLKQLYETPDDFAGHLRHTSGAIIMEIVYGIKILRNDDPYITTAAKAAAAVALAASPGAFLVDTLPILKYVPEWFPGAGFQKTAKLGRKHSVEMNTAPFNVVKQAIKSGTAEPSFTSSLLEESSVKGNLSPTQEKVIRDTGSTLYAGGADTMVAVLHSFFLAMVLFPEVQRKAQQELDRVVGSNRLPEYEDRENLPYINALCKELLRWHPITPIGTPHRVTQDDIINGYFIPAGATVLGNTWTLLHDKATYGPDADKFCPERFLNPEMKDPNATFGYGRRICPGRYFAENSIYMTVASTLSVYDTVPSRDSNGNIIPVIADFQSGFVSHPVPFKCTISPRSAAARRLILQPQE